MHTVQVLTLLLALSGALNIAFAAGLTARLAGAGPAQAILTAAGARTGWQQLRLAATAARRTGPWSRDDDRRERLRTASSAQTGTA